MKYVDIEEWKIKPDELPNKEFREKNNNVYHSITELENIEYGFLFYNIIEYRMGWYAGAFAILKDKISPEKIFDSEGLSFSKTFNTDFYYAPKSNIVQLVRGSYNPDNRTSEHTFCLLDVQSKLFSIVSFDCSDFYCLKEVENRKFIIELDKAEALNRYLKREKLIIDYFIGELISCDSLLWMDFSQILNYDSIYWSNREKFRIEL